MSVKLFKKNPPCLSLGALLDTANARVHRAAERRAWTRRFGGKLAPWRQASGWRSAGGARLRSLPAMNRQLPLLQLEMSRSKLRLPRMLNLVFGLVTAATMASCLTNPPLAPVSFSGPAGPSGRVRLSGAPNRARRKSPVNCSSPLIATAAPSYNSPRLPCPSWSFRSPRTGGRWNSLPTTRLIPAAAGRRRNWPGCNCRVV